MILGPFAHTGAQLGFRQNGFILIDATENLGTAPEHLSKLFLNDHSKKAHPDPTPAFQKEENCADSVLKT